jgi:hypothetical protein
MRAMSPAMLYRLSGLALIASVPFWLVGEAIHPPGEGLDDVLNSNQAVSHAILFVGWVFVLFGLFGMYARQAGRAGVLGLVGFALMVVVAVFHLYLLAYEAGPMAMLSTHPAARDLFAADGPVSRGTLRGVFIPFSIGAIVYGIATLRAGVYSRWVGGLIIAWLPVFALLGVLDAMVPAYAAVGRSLGSLLSSVGLSYGVLFVGLAIAGLQLWSGRERVDLSPQPA